MSTRMDPLSFTQVFEPWTCTQPAPYCAQGFGATGAGFFGCSAAMAMPGSSATITTSVLMGPLYRGQRRSESAVSLRCSIPLRRPAGWIGDAAARACEPADACHLVVAECEVEYGEVL